MANCEALNAHNSKHVEYTWTSAHNLALIPDTAALTRDRLVLPWLAKRPRQLSNHFLPDVATFL